MLIRTLADLGHLIRDRRTRLELTQAQLAELVGVSRKWIVDLEAGKRTADVSLILRTIKALGLEVEVKERSGHDVTKGVDVDQIIESSKRTKQ